VQRGKRLQVLLIRAMASHSKLRQQFLEELSRDPQFRARLFRLAGQKA
jgi:hypothetical protein